MAQPSSRQDLIDYCKRQLGAPVVEVNVANEQVQDLIDDALQLFYERHYDGVMQTYLKYKVTKDDIDRGKGPGQAGVSGITTTTVDKNVGLTTQFSYEENQNYLQIPPAVIGINKIYKFDGTQTVTNNMFSIKYQLFLNDIYYWGSTELLTYAMTRTYMSDIDFLLTTDKQIRFNQRQDRLYIDMDWSEASVGNWIIIDCFRTIDAADYDRVWNDFFLKKYATALIKRQWGMNLIKFQGVKLPGGIEFNGRQIYDDAQRELDIIQERMSSTYELPPLDMIG
tara:strand:- start:2059 stop:2901 length:843 start_codon:yes stop_codon:yes gene_type:complete